jgi:hyperosmotically inducible protein
MYGEGRVMSDKTRIVRVLELGLFAAALLVAQNGADTSQTAKSAVDQREINASDQRLTQKLRAAIMADKSLSTDARNVKISSQGGRITLKGPVRSQEEAQKLVAKAIVLTSSDGNVDNQLSVRH